MFFKNFIQTRTVMLKRKLIHRFDENMRYGEDFDLWMRILSEGVTFGISKQQLSFVFREEFSSGGLSSNLLNMEKSELKVLYRHYRSGDLNFFLFFFSYLWSIFKFITRSLRRLY